MGGTKALKFLARIDHLITFSSPNVIIYSQKWSLLKGSCQLKKVTFRGQCVPCCATFCSIWPSCIMLCLAVWLYILPLEMNKIFHTCMQRIPLYHYTTMLMVRRMIIMSHVSPVSLYTGSDMFGRYSHTPLQY